MAGKSSGAIMINVKTSRVASIAPRGFPGDISTSSFASFPQLICVEPVYKWLPLQIAATHAVYPILGQVTSAEKRRRLIFGACVTDSLEVSDSMELSDTMKVGDSTEQSG